MPIISLPYKKEELKNMKKADAAVDVYSRGFHCPQRCWLPFPGNRT